MSVAKPAGAGRLRDRNSSWPDAGSSESLRRLVPIILVLAVSYQAVLCLIHTQIFPVSRVLVGAAEFALMLACVPLLAKRVLPGVVLTGVLFFALVCFLALLRGSVDLKLFRDLLIPVVFYWLGRNVGDPWLADRALYWAMGVFFFFAAFEFVALKAYTSVFDIYSYYVSIGNLQTVDYARSTDLQLNGMRPVDIGRKILPSVFGLHRISSVFLEPVSVGNLAAIVGAWGLSKNNREWRSLVGFFLAAVALVVVSDSRFGLAILGVMLVVRFLFRGWLLYTPYLLPLLIVPILLWLGWSVDQMHGDNYVSRLVVSGRALLGFDLTTLLGLSATANFADMGYAHVLAAFGIFGAMGLWLLLWLIPMPDERGRRYRALIGIYAAMILCVSGTSLFAFKTAALMWFLLGCLLLDPAALRSRSGSSFASDERADTPGIRTNERGA